MLNLYISPRNYISGYDNIDQLSEHIKRFGKKFLILTTDVVYEILKDKIENLEKDGYEITLQIGNLKCTYNEVEKLKEIMIKEEKDAVIGMGGGKMMDTAKAVSFMVKKPVITVPTIAATCASWASHSAMYTVDGISYEYMSVEKNPDLVFVDKKIIFEAPVRYIVSGMVDTLAKWIETRAYTRNINEKNIQLEIAIFLAKRAYNDIFTYGKKVVEDIKRREYTKEVDLIIEHIIFTAGLIGGIGGEACRAVAAHAINNGLTVLYDRYNEMLHGEVVGFGNIVQMFLDNENEEDIIKLINLYKDIEAPIGLDMLNFDEISDDELTKVINKSMYREDTMWNLPYKVDFGMIKAAIEKADNLCKTIR